LPLIVVIALPGYKIVFGRAAENLAAGGIEKNTGTVLPGQDAEQGCLGLGVAKAKNQD